MSISSMSKMLYYARRVGQLISHSQKSVFLVLVQYCWSVVLEKRKRIHSKKNILPFNCGVADLVDLAAAVEVTHQTASLPIAVVSTVLIGLL